MTIEPKQLIGTCNYGGIPEFVVMKTPLLSFYEDNFHSCRGGETHQWSSGRIAPCHGWFSALRDIGSANGAEAKKAAIEQLIEVLVLLEDAFVKCSKGKAFFGGNQIGFLDIAFGSYLGWLRVTEKMNEVKLLDEVKTPGLFKWAERFCADAAVKDVMPETDKLAELKASAPPSS
ncbi:hypothetical protein WN943_020618 [Citrus x changshan-huyou]